MTELANLQVRATELRAKFKGFERKQDCKPWTRSDLILGLVGDIGALAKLSMAADGLRKIPDFKAKLGHELADCFWSLLVIAHEYDVNLVEEFEKLCIELHKKIDGKI